MGILDWLFGAAPHETFPDYTGDDEEQPETMTVDDLVQSIHDNVEKAPGETDESDSEAETDANADSDGEGDGGVDGGDSGGDGDR